MGEKEIPSRPLSSYVNSREWAHLVMLRWKHVYCSESEEKVALAATSNIIGQRHRLGQWGPARGWISVSTFPILAQRNHTPLDWSVAPATGPNRYMCSCTTKSYFLFSTFQERNINTYVWRISLDPSRVLFLFKYFTRRFHKGDRKKGLEGKGTWYGNETRFRFRDPFFIDVRAEACDGQIWQRAAQDSHIHFNALYYLINDLRVRLLSAADEYTVTGRDEDVRKTRDGTSLNHTDGLAMFIFTHPTVAPQATFPFVVYFSPLLNRCKLVGESSGRRLDTHTTHGNNFHPHSLYIHSRKPN